MRASLLLLLACVATPAVADHMGPSGVGGGGGFTVFGPGTLDEGHGSLGFRLTYTRPQHRSDTELESLSVAGTDAHNTDYNLNASISAGYGINHHVTLSMELPYVRRDDLRVAEGGEVERLGSIAGLGDLNFLAKYRLTDGETGGFALIAGIKVPTGSTELRDGNGERLETEHQPGTGSWDPIFGASAATTFGPVQLTASALYQLSGKGAQHTRLGDRFQGGIVLSHRFGDAEHHDHSASLNHHHGDELDEHADHRHPSWDAFVELSGEWEGRQEIAGEVEQASGGKLLWLAPGARFNSASGLSFAASIGVPVWQDIRASHPENRFRLSLSIARAF
jgi:hypothetical protein